MKKNAGYQTGKFGDPTDNGPVNNLKAGNAVMAKGGGSIGGDDGNGRVGVGGMSNLGKGGGDPTMPKLNGHKPGGFQSGVKNSSHGRWGN
jgi:hypothetical protein